MKNVERRLYLENVELRETEEDGKPKIFGYGAVYESRSEDLGGFQEIFKRGCFDESINRNDDIRCLYNHDTSKVLGRRKSGTLKVGVNDRGLWIEDALPDTPTASEVRELVGRGDISGMSVGFYIEDAEADQSWDKEGDRWLRTVLKATVVEVSAVAFPAYTDTSVAMRSLNAIKETQEQHFSTEQIETEQRMLRLRLAKAAA